MGPFLLSHKDLGLGGDVGRRHHGGGARDDGDGSSSGGAPARGDGSSDPELRAISLLEGEAHQQMIAGGLLNQLNTL